jgi:hypothetical protein
MQTVRLEYSFFVHIWNNEEWIQKSLLILIIILNNVYQVLKSIFVVYNFCIVTISYNKNIFESAKQIQNSQTGGILQAPDDLVSEHWLQMMKFWLLCQFLSEIRKAKNDKCYACINVY